MADKSIPELSQFEYYRGLWSVQMEIKQKDGSFKKMEGESTIRGMFLKDHKTFQSQYSTKKGAFTTDIRTYNTETKEWKALFLNARAQRWHQFSSKIIDGKMTTIVKGGYSGNEEYDVKAIDIIISNNQYQRNFYYSRDNMRTWKLIYKMMLDKIN